MLLGVLVIVIYILISSPLKYRIPYVAYFQMAIDLYPYSE